MKISIKRSYLGNMLDKASVVSMSSAGESLNSFLIEADGDWLSVIRTDKMVSVVARNKLFDYIDPPHPDGHDKRFLVHAPRLLTLVKNLDCEVITLDNSDGVGIVADTFNGRWLMDDLSKFPPIPSPSGVMFNLIDTQELLKAIDRVKYAATYESTYAEHKQIFFHNGECWATDGARLQQVMTALPNDFSLVLPVAVMDALKFIKFSGSDKVSFAKDKHYYIFKIGSDECICRIPGVKIPSYADEYVKKYAKSLIGSFQFEVPRLVGILKRVGVTSAIGSCGVEFALSGANPTISGNDGYGNKSSEVLVSSYSGMAKKFSVHWSDMVNALLSVREGSATFKIYDMFVSISSKDSLSFLPMLSV